MSPKKGSSRLKQPDGILTPEAEKRRALEEAKKLDETGARHTVGEIILDRDGREWRITNLNKKDGAVRYHIVPIPKPEYGEMGYVFRMVADDDVDGRTFGFRHGGRLRMHDGKLVSIPSKYT